MKRIWFVSHYSMPPKYEMRIKTQMYAHYLGLKGYDCTIFSASTIHNTNINLIKDSSEYVEKKYDDLKFVHIKACNYKGNGLIRIINMLQFAYRFKKIAKKFIKPDVVIADANCINYEPIYMFCRDNSIPLILEVRDLWPLSIVEHLKYNPKSFVIKYLYQREKKMLQRMSAIIFSMGGYKDYLRDRELSSIINKSFYINNGVDIKDFSNNRISWQIKDKEIINEDYFKVIYTGSIRKVNNLDLLLDAAKLINNSRVKIFIYGDGDRLDSLKERIKNEKIENVFIKGYVEKKYIPYIVSKADLNIVHGSSSITLFKYGISPNKLFDYMAAGKPILVDFKSSYNPVVMEGIGEEITNSNPLEIAKAIDGFASMDIQKYNELCKKTFEAAKKYDYRSLTEQLLSIIKQVI